MTPGPFKSAVAFPPPLDIALIGVFQATVPPAAVVLLPIPAFKGPTVIELPGGHVDEDVKEPVPPGQILMPVVTGEGITVTVTISVFVHPVALVPVAVYVVVLTGLAITAAPVIADNPVAGDQLKVTAPLAVNEVLLPLQIVAEAGVREITGNEITATSTTTVFVHPFASVPVTV